MCNTPGWWDKAGYDWILHALTAVAWMVSNPDLHDIYSVIDAAFRRIVGEGFWAAAAVDGEPLVSFFRQ